MRALAALALVLSAGPGWSAPPAGAEADYPREVVHNIDAWTPLHCRDVVLEALAKIWKDCGRGSSELECAFRVDSVPAAGGEPRLEIVHMGPDVTRDDRRAFKRTVEVVKRKTIAIFHTHPEATEPGIGIGDDDVPVPLNYVIHGRRGGLYVWDRDLGASRSPIRPGTQWKKPCGDRDLERARERLRRVRDLKAAASAP